MVETGWPHFEMPDAARFCEFVENVTDVIYWTDDCGRFTFMNPAAIKAMKCRERDMLGRSFMDCVAPSHRAAVGTFYAEQLRERRVHSYLELPMVNAVGETIWLGQSVRLVFDDAGAVLGFQALSRDITAQKAQERDRDRLILELQMALAGMRRNAGRIAIAS